MWGRICFESPLCSGSLSSLTQKARNPHTPPPPPRATPQPPSLLISALTFHRPRTTELQTVLVKRDHTKFTRGLLEKQKRQAKRKYIHSSDFSHYTYTWTGKFYFSSEVRDIEQYKKSLTISTMTQLTLNFHWSSTESDQKRPYSQAT